jgi:hypothetical protein
MSPTCEGCSLNQRPWSVRTTGFGIHRALVIAGSVSNAQRRTFGFEMTGVFSAHPENECDLTINIGRKALLSFLYDEDRPSLALDTWLGRADEAKYAQQMTSHQYTFNVLAVDDATRLEIQQRGDYKLFGIPLYVIERGSLNLVEFDPDGSQILIDIPRM